MRITPDVAAKTLTIRDSGIGSKSSIRFRGGMGRVRGGWRKSDGACRVVQNAWSGGGGAGGEEGGGGDENVTRSDEELTCSPVRSPSDQG